LAMPLPPILRVSSEFVLNNEIRRSLSSEKVDCERLQRLIESATHKGVALDGVNVALRERLDRTMNRWSADPFEVQTLGQLEVLIPLLRAVSVEADLWEAQNTYYELMKAITPLSPQSVGNTSVELFRSLGRSLGIFVQEAILPVIEEEIRIIPVPQAPELQLSISVDS
jgi:hypothetical protein